MTIETSQPNASDDNSSEEETLEGSIHPDISRQHTSPPFLPMGPGEAPLFPAGGVFRIGFAGRGMNRGG